MLRTLPMSDPHIPDSNLLSVIGNMIKNEKKKDNF